MLLVGDKDIEANCVSVRKRGEGDIGAMGIDEFVELIVEQVKSRIIF
jgi:threonyl-tRNA synthetase